jgi:hypothetical protein
MDGECAFCGRAVDAVREVFCEDCQARHKVCKQCVDEVASATEGYRLVA